MGKSVLVGYRYYMGLHFGLCHGPVDALLEIRAGDRTAWSGTHASSGTVTIEAPNLFGGDDREGGVAGSLDVMMGEQTQAANAYLTAVQGGQQPAYRGFVGAVFRGADGGGMVGAMNPYIKPWSFKVRRVSQGWRTPVFYSSKAAITMGAVQAMNPAHIIYQCLTDTEWGMGYPTAMIDTSSFTAAADALHAEGFGLCLQWARQDTIENFLRLVIDHIGAVLLPDRTTGRWTLRLIRGDYTPSSLPLFDETNIVELSSYQRATEYGLPNEITVVYRDPTTNKDAPVTVQNAASIQAQGGIVHQTRQYPGIPTAALAGRVAMRDLAASSTPLAKVQFVANRQAYAVKPGDPIRFAWSRLGIAQMILRVGRVDYGELRNGRVVIEAVEDVFGLPSAVYLGQQAGQWTAPSNAPQPSGAVQTIEAPYRDVYQVTEPGTLGTYDDQSCFVLGVAKRPSSGLPLSVEFQTRVGTAAYVARDTQPWTPHGVTAAAISRTDTTVTLAAGATDLSQLAVGDCALLGTEIVRIDGISGNVLTIARGCLDTVPQAHAAGTVFWGYDRFAAADRTEYANGENVNGRYITIATGGRLADGSAPVSSVTTARRFGRPYPPGDLKLNGARYPASISGILTVSWVHRDRITQADQVLDTLAGSVGPEAGVTYTLELYDQTGTLRRTYTGLTGTSQTWDTESTDSGLTPPTLNSQVRVRLWAVRSGLDSYQRHDFTVQRV